jgi:quercetin dioxygenase-like cupin family protein
MYDRKLDSTLLPWSPLDFAGVSMRVLHTDEPTGAMTVMTKMEPGARIPAHSHSLANETVYVIEGDFVEDGFSHGPGSFFSGSAGTVHGPHATAHGCVLLTTFSAKLDFVLAG